MPACCLEAGSSGVVPWTLAGLRLVVPCVRKQFKFHNILRKCTTYAVKSRKKSSHLVQGVEEQNQLLRSLSVATSSLSLGRARRRRRLPNAPRVHQSIGRSIDRSLDRRPLRAATDCCDRRPCPLLTRTHSCVCEREVCARLRLPLVGSSCSPADSVAPPSQQLQQHQQLLDLLAIIFFFCRRKEGAHTATATAKARLTIASIIGDRRNRGSSSRARQLQTTTSSTYARHALACEE